VPENTPRAPLPCDLPPALLKGKHSHIHDRREQPTWTGHHLGTPYTPDMALRPEIAHIMCVQTLSARASVHVPHQLKPSSDTSSFGFARSLPTCCSSVLTSHTPQGKQRQGGAHAARWRHEQRTVQCSHTRSATATGSRGPDSDSFTRPHTQAYALTPTQRHAEQQQQAARWLHTPTPMPVQRRNDGPHAPAARGKRTTQRQYARQTARHTTLCDSDTSGGQHTVP